MIIFKLKKEEDKNIRYPEDIPIIRDYLEEHGSLINVSDRTLSDAWDDFSDYHDAGWLNVSEYWLDEFVHWLDGRDVKVW